MAEINRNEAMKQIGEWYGGFAGLPSENAIHKAISDMQKLEKIEQIMDKFNNYNVKSLFALKEIERILQNRTEN